MSGLVAARLQKYRDSHVLSPLKVPALWCARSCPAVYGPQGIMVRREAMRTSFESMHFPGTRILTRAPWSRAERIALTVMSSGMKNEAC